MTGAWEYLLLFKNRFLGNVVGIFFFEKETRNLFSPFLRSKNCNLLVSGSSAFPIYLSVYHQMLMLKMALEWLDMDDFLIAIGERSDKNRSLVPVSGKIQNIGG